MRSFWHTKEGNKGLLLFFLGWGMDETPFLPLKTSGLDLLLLYDYRDLVLPPLPESYQRIMLLAWSFGVYAALHCLSGGLLPKLEKAVFLNGTGAPYDRAYGIPPRVFDVTYKAFERAPQETLFRFYQNMFLRREDWRRFKGHLPRRDFEELREELACARQWPPLFCSPPVGKALWAAQDAIFPPAHQRRYWETLSFPAEEILEGHFPFYRFQYLEQLVEEPRP